MVDDTLPPGVAPWGPRDPDTRKAPPPAPPQAEPSRLKTWVWGAISTLLLAGWIAWQMGWLWAVAAIVGVFVHEIGHVLVINWAGSGPSRIRIIPFFGGAATMARPPLTDFKGVLIALAGPAFGLLATLPFFALAAWTGDAAWKQGAFVVAAINLLNLAPAPPLDGSKALGPLLARVHPMLERAAPPGGRRPGHDLDVEPRLAADAPDHLAQRVRLVARQAAQGAGRAAQLERVGARPGPLPGGAGALRGPGGRGGPGRRSSFQLCVRRLRSPPMSRRFWSEDAA